MEGWFDTVIHALESRWREEDLVDAFEQLVSEILWMEGYWVRTSVKVELTKKEKVKIGRSTSPRWELDIVAYRAQDNLLRVVECKSYIDSGGVALRAFNGNDKRFAERFKLFNDKQLRQVVFSRLRKQFTATGACGPKPAVRLCLACGRIASNDDREGLHKLLQIKGGSYGTSLGFGNGWMSCLDEAMRMKFQQWWQSCCLGIRSNDSLQNMRPLYQKLVAGTV